MPRPARVVGRGHTNTARRIYADAVEKSLREDGEMVFLTDPRVPCRLRRCIVQPVPEGPRALATGAASSPQANERNPWARATRPVSISPRRGEGCMDHAGYILTSTLARSFLNEVAGRLHQTRIADATWADLMRTVKARSSHWVHKTFPAFARFAWQAGWRLFPLASPSRTTDN